MREVHTGGAQGVCPPVFSNWPHHRTNRSAVIHNRVSPPNDCVNCPQDLILNSKFRLKVWPFHPFVVSLQA